MNDPYLLIINICLFIATFLGFIYFFAKLNEIPKFVAYDNLLVLLAIPVTIFWFYLGQEVVQYEYTPILMLVIAMYLITYFKYMNNGKISYGLFIFTYLGSLLTLRNIFVDQPFVIESLILYAIFALTYLIFNIAKARFEIELSPTQEYFFVKLLYSILIITIYTTLIIKAIITVQLILPIAPFVLVLLLDYFLFVRKETSGGPKARRISAR